MRQIKDVYVGIEPFEPEIIAAHGLLIFTMHTDRSVTAADGFGISVSRCPLNHVEKWTRFNIPGVWTEIRNGVSSRGIADQLQRVTRFEGHIWMHRLALTQDQKVTLVKDTLMRSTEDMSGEWYHSMSNFVHRVRRSIERRTRTRAEDGQMDQLSEDGQVDVITIS
jgi:hypothetical protein